MDIKWEEAEECLKRIFPTIAGRKIVNLLHTYLRVGGLIIILINLL